MSSLRQLTMAAMLAFLACFLPDDRAEAQWWPTAYYGAYPYMQSTNLDLGRLGYPYSNYRFNPAFSPYGYYGYGGYQYGYGYSPYRYGYNPYRVYGFSPYRSAGFFGEGGFDNDWFFDFFETTATPAPQEPLGHQAGDFIPGNQSLRSPNEPLGHQSGELVPD